MKRWLVIAAFAIACSSALTQAEIKSANKVCDAINPGDNADPNVTLFCERIHSLATGEAGSGGVGGSE
jgi:hypothetical protein